MSTAGRQSCMLSNSSSAAFCATAHFAGPPILGMCIRKHNGTRVMASKQLASTEVLVLFHQFVGLFCRRRFTTPGIPAYAVKQNVSCPAATANLLRLLFRLTQLSTTLWPSIYAILLDPNFQTYHGMRLTRFRVLCLKIRSTNICNATEYSVGAFLSGTPATRPPPLSMSLGVVRLARRCRSLPPHSESGPL